MDMRSFLGSTLVVAFLLGPAGAEVQPRSVKADARIKTVSYQRDNIISLLGMMGVATMIEFKDDEKIATISMGDTVGWQAVPDQSKRYLFIKPLEPNASTNMNVVTSKRVYNFMLHGAAPGDTRKAIIKLRFTYPEDDADARLVARAQDDVKSPNLKAALADPSKLNYGYDYKGSIQNKPTRVFDDGVKTFFQFPVNWENPAIFAVKSDGTETLINYRREADFIVVDKVAGQWTLRNGAVSTCVFNRQAIKAD